MLIIYNVLTGSNMTSNKNQKVNKMNKLDNAIENNNFVMSDSDMLDVLVTISPTKAEAWSVMLSDVHTDNHKNMLQTANDVLDQVIFCDYRVNNVEEDADNNDDFVWTFELYNQRTL